MCVCLVCECDSCVCVYVMYVCVICVCLSRDLEAATEPLYSVKAHKEIVNSLDGVGGLGVGDGAPEIVTGSRDGEALTYTILHNTVQYYIILHTITATQYYTLQLHNTT